jgi:hypothetical protein
MRSLSANSRIPLEDSERFVLREPDLSEETCRKLLKFYKDYQEKNWLTFLALRSRWHEQNPGQLFPGLCANINPLSGEFRPLSEQFLWGWGDGRALGIWAASLILDRVPEKTVEAPLFGSSYLTLQIKKGLEEYIDIIYHGLLERYKLNGNFIPFKADFRTGLTVEKPIIERRFDFTQLFVAGGMIQYGMLRRDEEAFGLGMEILDSSLHAIHTKKFDHPLKSAYPGATFHGPQMIALGAIVDFMKSNRQLEGRGEERYSRYQDDLLSRSFHVIQSILDNHYRPSPPAFWELGDGKGQPLANEKGEIIVDPGHATECAGFIAEMVPFLPEDWGSAKWNRQTVLEAALAMHLFADDIGISPRGVMVKYVDLEYRKILPDTQAARAGGKPTAPWWNIREHCASALRLYTLTRDTRLLYTYAGAQRASYLCYPNKRIGGQMIQTVDPFSLEPMDIAPATGNLDPMHDLRARLREMENLEILLHEKP